MSQLNINYYNDGASSTSVEILAPPFYGSYTSSPNGQYAIAFSDANYSGSTFAVGDRKNGHGKYMLLSGQKILHSGKLQRPNDGWVANNGTFIINDYLFSDKLTGIVYVFSESGTILLKRSVKANLLNAGISNNGRYVCFQTCNSDYEDANSLFIYDVSSAMKISQLVLPCSWASKYRFDEENRIIYLNMKNGKSYRITFDGTFLDQDRWDFDWEHEAAGVDALELAKSKFSDIRSKNMSDYAIINSLLDRSLSEFASPNLKARVNRIRGEIFLNCEDRDNAIKYFEIALGFDERVGIRKKLIKLKEGH